MKASVVAKAPKSLELYWQEGLRWDAIVHVKYFTPDSNWIWWVTEFDSKDAFIGLVDGFEKGVGCFSLSRVEGVNEGSDTPGP